MSAILRNVFTRAVPRAVAAPRLRPIVANIGRRAYTDISEVMPTPIFHLNESEAMLRESVERFANEAILPKVREMDEAENMDKGIVKQLFEQGLMGIEIPEKFGGAEMNFGAAIVAIEELARVDPSVWRIPSRAIVEPVPNWRPRFPSWSTSTTPSSTPSS